MIPVLLLALLAPAGAAPVPVDQPTETRCAYIVSDKDGTHMVDSPPLHVLADTASPAPYAPPIPAGAASVGGRVPLGRVVSRRLAGEDSIPAPPNGYRVVRFKTDFATKRGATETLSLAREADGWRVAGYVID